MLLIKIILDHYKIEIDNDPVMKQKQSNDTVISAYKNMVDEAEKNLLKEGNTDDASKRIRGLKANLDFTRANLNKDLGGGFTYTDQDLFDAEEAYREALKEETTKWIDGAGKNNEVITRNMEVISKYLFMLLVLGHIF